MKTHTYTLMAALLASSALVAPAYAEAEPGSTGDLAGDLLKLEQESWNHFKFCFNIYAEMCNNKIGKEEAIQAIYESSRRIRRISSIIYRSCHTPHDDQLMPFRDVVLERKFREGIALRDKATRGIVDHIKQNNYYGSEDLKKATENLLGAIGMRYPF